MTSPMPTGTIAPVNFDDVRLLYLRELRSALRERGIVTGSILMPLLMYPVLLWAVFTAGVFIQGQEERFQSRIALVDLPPEHRQLEDELLEEEGAVELVEPGEVRAAAWADAIAAGELDAVAEVLPAAEPDAALAHNFRLRLTFDGSKDRSVKARRRVESALDAYRQAWIERRGSELGIGERQWQGPAMERLDLASSSEKGAFILGLMVPLLMIVMIAIGCFYPAIDATAGERERSTWETLMTVAASRTSVVVAKYLYVATLGGAAGLLNLFAMTLSMRLILAPLIGDSGLEFEIPYAALPLLALAAVLLAMFVAAGMMIFAAFARTFKEGQSMVGPFYLLCFLPALFVQSPDLELDLELALIPIVNVAMIFREAIGGVYNWPMIAVALAVTALTVVACLAVARFILSFEDVVIGSYRGNFVKLLSDRLVRFRSPNRNPREIPP